MGSTWAGASPGSLPPEPVACALARAAWLTAFSYSHSLAGLTGQVARIVHSQPMNTQKSHTQPVNTPDQPAAGKGQPAREQQPQKPMLGRQPDFKDGSTEQTLELPRDRDEAKDMTSGQNSPLIKQAAADVNDGLQDTSKALETDKAYEKLRP